MADTVLYGLFNNNGQITEQLNIEIEKPQFQHVYSQNFEKFQNKDEILFFNGVLYNKEELKEYLGSDSNDDAQILFELYSKENYQGFRRINGKFLIIINSETKTIVVRDRYGQGPLFYYNKECFTNLFWQLKSFKNLEFEPDITALGNYLMYSYIPSPLSSFKNISKLAGGDVLIKQGDQFKTEPLFSFEDFTSESVKIDEQEALEEYDRLFKLSIKIQ